MPPIITKNKIYENQKFMFINPQINEIIIVCVSKISPIDRGWLVNKNRILKVNSKLNINSMQRIV